MHHRSSAGVFNQDVDNFIQSDATNVAHHFAETWQEITDKIKKPNVLLMGVTGAGKSSVINAVFGAQVAMVGAGVPITQNYTKIDLPRHPVTLYDSKGLEHGHHEEFILETKHFLAEHHDSADASDRIHVIWYVINAANARFQHFEEQLCKEILKDIPIVFILNKADICPEATRKMLFKTITDMNLRHSLGVYETVADSKQKEILRQIDACPECGSENITISSRKKTCTCDDCGHTTSIAIKNGLDQVVKKTIETLPEFAKDAFISAQTFSFSLKEDRGFEIIREHYADAIQVRMFSTLRTDFAKMLTRLAILWDFKKHGPLYCLMVTKELFGAMPLSERIFLFLNKRNHLRLETTAMGILWARCLVRMEMILLNDIILKGRRVEDINAEWEQVLDKAFVDLNEENLDAVIASIQTRGLDITLEQSRFSH